MGHSARVWRVYLDEAEQYDAEMVDGFKDTTDVLLVFAGLFSAVVTTFVVQSSQALQPNYQQTTVSLLSELIELQLAAVNGSSIPSSSLTISGETSAASDLWVNGLWFASLSISLSVALIAVLVKQWIQNYTSALTGTSRDRVLERQFRFMGLNRWQVPVIVGFLPTLLHIALFMFLAGLATFVWGLDFRLGAMTTAIGGSLVLLYILSNILPSVYPNCPYKNPVAEFINHLIQYLRWIMGWFTFLARNIPPWKYPYFRLVSLKDAAKVHVRNGMDQLISHSLLWLHSASSNPTGRRVVAQAIAAVPFDFSATAVLRERDLLLTIYQELEASAGTPEMEPLYRSFALVRAYEYHDFEILRTKGSKVAAINASIPEDWLGVSMFNKFKLAGRLLYLLSKGVKLPPALWERLFTNIYDSENFHCNGSDLLKLLVMTINILSTATFDNISLSVKSQGQWDLLPALTLADLCRCQTKMSLLVLYFVAFHLVRGNSKKAVLDLLSSSPHKPDPTMIIGNAVLFLLNPKNQFRFNESDLDSLEGTLMSLKDKFTNPKFSVLLRKAIHQLGEVETGTHLSVLRRARLLLKSEVSRSMILVSIKSMRNLMAYFMDVLRHPWPLADSPCFKDVDMAGEILFRLFALQEPEIFKVFEDRNGLEVLQRNSPIDFRNGQVFSAFNPWLLKSLCPYVMYVGSHWGEHFQTIEALLHPRTLAWLMWLSCCNFEHPIPTSVQNDLTAVRLFQRSSRDVLTLLLALQDDPELWQSAARILIGELHRDAGNFGPSTSLFDSKIAVQTYAALYQVLQLVGINMKAEEYVLYRCVPGGYIPQNEMEIFMMSADGMSTYGPYTISWNPNQIPQSVPRDWTVIRERDLLRHRANPYEPVSSSE